MTDAEVEGSLRVYLAFGLRVRSQVPLPELSVVADRAAPSDGEVRVIDAPVYDAIRMPAGLADVADEIAMLWWPRTRRSCSRVSLGS